MAPERRERDVTYINMFPLTTPRTPSQLETNAVLEHTQEDVSMTPAADPHSTIPLQISLKPCLTPRPAQLDSHGSVDYRYRTAPDSSA